MTGRCPKCFRVLKPRMIWSWHHRATVPCAPYHLGTIKYRGGLRVRCAGTGLPLFDIKEESHED